MVHLFSGSSADYVFQALGADGIFLVGQLQKFDFVDLRAGAFCQLLRDITSFQARNHVKSVWADHARDLLDRNVRVAAEIRHVAGIMLVGKNESHRVAMFLQCLIGAAHARLELFDAARGTHDRLRGCPVIRAEPYRNLGGALPFVQDHVIKPF